MQESIGPVAATETAVDEDATFQIAYSREPLPSSAWRVALLVTALVANLLLSHQVWLVDPNRLDDDPALLSALVTLVGFLLLPFVSIFAVVLLAYEPRTRMRTYTVTSCLLLTAAVVGVVCFR